MKQVILGVAIALTISVFLTSCSDIFTVRSDAERLVNARNAIKSTNNGVYYFSSDFFADTLSEFLGSHPCKIEGMAPFGNEAGTTGVVVVCR